MAPRRGLALATALASAVVLGQAPPPAPAPAQQTAPPPARPPPAARPPTDAPDDEFIEFLGEDDHGDAAFWEFLKKSAQGQQPAAPPPSPKQ